MERWKFGLPPRRRLPEKCRLTHPDTSGPASTASELPIKCPEPETAKAALRAALLDRRARPQRLRAAELLPTALPINPPSR